MHHRDVYQQMIWNSFPQASKSLLFIEKFLSLLLVPLFETTLTWYFDLWHGEVHTTEKFPEDGEKIASKQTTAAGEVWRPDLVMSNINLSLPLLQA